MSTIVDRFSRCHAADPQRAILHLPAAGDSLTTDALWQAHLACAHRFCDAGLQPGHLVISALGNRAAAVSLFLAARACDLALMAVDVATTAAEIEDLGNRYGAAAVALPADSPAQGRGAGHFDLVTTVRGHLQLARRYPDTAAMKLTSGTTGSAKATLTSEGQLVVDTTQIIAGMGIAPHDTQMAMIPLSHAYGLSVLLMPLLLQGTPIVLRESFLPQLFAQDAEQFAVTRVPGVPFMFQHFLSHPPDVWPAGIRRAMSAGARLSPDVARQFRDRFGLKIHSFYGTTESGGITYDGSDDGSDDTVGEPLPGVTITFRADEDAPPGSGRIHVRSASASNGYADVPDGAFCDGGYLTGDYGAFDERGRLTLTGRVSSFVNVAGKKVLPLEVEQVLRLMPGVEDVRVLTGTDIHRGEQVVACIVAGRTGRTPTTLDVRRFCSARLAPHKIPRAVLFLDTMPVTARGKTDRQALDALVRAELGKRD